MKKIYKNASSLIASSGISVGETCEGIYDISGNWKGVRSTNSLVKIACILRETVFFIGRH